MNDHPMPGPNEATDEADRFLDTVRGTAGDSRIMDAPAIDVAVEGGTVRVYHVPGTGSGSARPVVFISGWGTIPESFDEFYGALSREVELFHVETREKTSSRIVRRAARFDMDRFATDIRDAIHALQLADRNPVLMGTCFGSAVILHGLASGILDAPTVVCVDPMVRLWMPRWAILFLGSLPVFVVRLLRPVIRAIVLGGMREPVQRERVAAFINSSVIWKWRKGALQTRKWNLFDVVSRIRHRVYVLNGSHDRFHNSDLFPGVAQAIPDGVFIRVPVGEAKRERLMGVAASVFAATDAEAGVPPTIEEFVVPFQRDYAAPQGPNSTSDSSRLDQFDTA
jgi:pimeloyl-ACP methyl ester carboxylesterase